MSMRLCSDCRHWQESSMSSKDGTGTNYDRCSHPKAKFTKVDFVRGNTRLSYCESERSITGECNFAGTLWEPSMDMLTSTEQEASHVEP